SSPSAPQPAPPPQIIGFTADATINNTAAPARSSPSARAAATDHRLHSRCYNQQHRRSSPLQPLSPRRRHRSSASQPMLQSTTPITVASVVTPITRTRRRRSSALQPMLRSTTPPLQPLSPLQPSAALSPQPNQRLGLGAFTLRSD
ncbi:MAG: hypothetical protein ACI81V_000217, partial [Lentimonas sp.]